jgi:hypothetical protein
VEVAVPRADWTDEFLTSKRQVGDPPADQAIATVFSRGDISALDRFMGDLVANDALPPSAPPEVKAFLESSSALPPWADQERLKAAARLFNVHGLPSLVALAAASLPQCYLMHTGVRILDLTSQLGLHTNRRLHQTAAMVLAVMGPGGFEPGGTAIRQTQKVRLIHAAIRYRILSAIGAAGFPSTASAEVPVLLHGVTRSVNDVIALHGFDWQIARDGFPINQEDQAYTLLTFGHVIPLGIRSLGIKLSADDYNAFLHAWNVSGFILGVDEALMAHDETQAADLFARIKARQAAASDAGTRLTNAVLVWLEQSVLRLAVLRPLAPILMRMLNGDDTARMLGLDTRHHDAVVVLHRIVVVALRATQILMSPFSQVWQPMAPINAWIGRRVVDEVVRATDDGRVRQVAIPPQWR